MTIQYKPIAKSYGLFYFHSCNYRNSPIQFPPYLQQKKNMEDFLFLLTALNAVLKIIKSTTDLIRTLKKKKE